ncbi:MAG: type II toxin-antitoxin system VapC family toxin [Hormoscilla sp.]
MTTTLRYVVDANVGIKQFISDPLSPKVKQLFALLDSPQTEIFIPDLFYIECGSIFRKYVRAGLYTADEVQTDLISLKGLPLRVVSNADLMADAVSISLTHGIYVYDASYVALSEHVNAPLLTLDQRLVNTLAATSYDLRLFSDWEIPSLPSS